MYIIEPGEFDLQYTIDIYNSLIHVKYGQVGMGVVLCIGILKSQVQLQVWIYIYCDYTLE